MSFLWSTLLICFCFVIGEIHVCSNWIRYVVLKQQWDQVPAFPIICKTINAENLFKWKKTKPTTSLKNDHSVISFSILVSNQNLDHLVIRISLQNQIAKIWKWFFIAMLIFVLSNDKFLWALHFLFFFLISKFFGST